MRAYSEYLNKRADRTVMRYLHKRIDNKMDKELTDKAPPFAKLVEDVARTMESCGEPNRTYSMMDECAPPATRCDGDGHLRASAGQHALQDETRPPPGVHGHPLDAGTTRTCYATSATSTPL